MAKTLSLRVQNVEQVSWKPGIFKPKYPNLYVRVSQDGVNVLTTQVVKENLVPKWDAVANLKSASKSSVINVLLYHTPSIRMLPDICLGRCTLTIRELLQLDSQNEFYLDLKAKNKNKGRVTVQLSSEEPLPGQSTQPNMRKRRPSDSPGPSTSVASLRAPMTFMHKPGQSGQLTTAELNFGDNLTHIEVDRRRPAKTEQRMEEILQRCTRSRIVLVGGSGVGKSKLINYVFKINDAKVSDWQAGEANIYSEFTSEINPRFVLHDSKGFEPANRDTFDLVRKFIIERSDERLELKDRLHVVWLCIQTPTDGGRVIETGTERLLKLAHEQKIPVMVVFTQYDLLVRKYLYDQASPEDSLSSARRDFDVCVQSLERAVKRLGIEMPMYINVSVIPGYDDSIVPLVEMTRQTVEQYVGDAWVVWVAAQRTSFKLKIDACVEKGMKYYWRSLSGSIPGAGKMLLQQCLLQVHRDIIACCNLRDQQNVLNSEEFRQLMLYDIQDMEDNAPVKPSPVDKIADFVTLCNTASAAIAPPIAILGITVLFLKWISDAVLDNTPKAKRILIAYTVDLLLVLEELFNMTLPIESPPISLPMLQVAFQVYDSQRMADEVVRDLVHQAVRHLVENHGRLDTDLAVENVKGLLQQYGVI